MRQPGGEGFAGQVDLRARLAAVPSAPKSRLVVRSSLGAKATRDVAVVENGLVVTVGPIDLVQGLSDQECARRSPLGRPATTSKKSTRPRRVADQIDVVGQWRVHLGTSPTGASSPRTTRPVSRRRRRVYIVVESDGHVTVHRGIRSRGETKRAKRKADGD